MNKYNSRNIRKHKGKLIQLEYRNRNGFIDIQTGEIIAHTVSQIIFNVNKSKGSERIEKSIKYEKIINISDPELAD